MKWVYVEVLVVLAGVNLPGDPMELELGHMKLSLGWIGWLAQSCGSRLC